MPIGEVAAVGSSLVWAAASLLFTRLGTVFDPRTLNLAKTGFAAALLWLTLWWVEGLPWPSLTHAEFGWLAASAVVGLAIGDTAMFRALNLIGPRRTLVVWALVPPVTAAMAVPTLGEPVTLALAVGIGLTCGGVLWVVAEGNPGQASAVSLAGVGFAFLSMLCQSSSNILVKLGGAHTSALGVSVVRLVVGAACLAVHVGFARRLHELGRLRQRSVGGRLVVAAFLGTYLGIWLSMVGLQYAPAAVAATLGTLSPVFVIPLVWVFDGERPSVRAIGGACLAVVGVAVLFLL